MSSDEDFSLVVESGQPMESLEGIKKAISNYKMQYEQLLQEQKELFESRDVQKDMAEQFRQRSQKLIRSLEEDQRTHSKDIDLQKEKLHDLQREESQLRNQLKVTEAALDETEANNSSLKQQTELSTADVPEKRVVFTGETGDATSTETFHMKAHIVYPMEGGTALITFEEEIVAQKILDMKNHTVDLEKECAITLVAKPIQLMVPCIVEMDTQVCPQRILVSNLPKETSSDILLDKLEIHFAKRRNGGGEVEDRDMQDDSGNVVITFVETNIAKTLADKQYHEVEFDKGKRHRVKVTPFLNGEITKLKNEQTVCARTVLLTGIPAVTEQENLQDLLEIHFQKPSNGGGEVDAILYNPLGQHAFALFDEESECPNVYTDNI